MSAPWKHGHAGNVPTPLTSCTTALISQNSRPNTATFRMTTRPLIRSTLRKTDTGGPALQDNQKSAAGTEELDDNPERLATVPRWGHGIMEAPARAIKSSFAVSTENSFDVPGYTPETDSDHDDNDEEQAVVNAINEKPQQLPNPTIANSNHATRLPNQLTHSLTHSLAHSLTHSPTHSPTHPPTHSLTHPPTHSLTNT